MYDVAWRCNMTIVRSKDAQWQRALSTLIIWSAPWAGKMNRILRCDWLPERARYRWSYLARSGLLAVSRKKNVSESHYNKSFIYQACPIKLAGYWPRFLCEFMDLDFVSVRNHAKKELGQYPTILTSHLVNNPYLLFQSRCCHVDKKAAGSYTN